LIPLVHCVLWSWKQDEKKKGETQGSGKLVEKLDGGYLDGGWDDGGVGGKGGKVFETSKRKDVDVVRYMIASAEKGDEANCQQ
jgi:hypothetical protein